MLKDALTDIVRSLHEILYRVFLNKHKFVQKVAKKNKTKVESVQLGKTWNLD